MTNALKFTCLLGVIFLTALLIITLRPSFSFGSAPSGLNSSVSSSTRVTLSDATATFLFATSSQCASRAISTRGGAVVLTFSDRFGNVPGPVLGHVQAASTTVVYDSGLYGCDALRIYSFGAQVVDITETR